MDREKVIECLQKAKMVIETWIPMFEQYNTPTGIDDAIALLKEQEAVEPRRDANCVRMFRCGVCSEYVGFIDSDHGDPNEQDNYCRNCGRKVKWNERIHRASNSTRND